MKMKNLIGAFLVAIVTALSMPAIAQPPDSPPKAQPVMENENVSDFIAGPADALFIHRTALASINYAIMSDHDIVPIRSGDHQRMTAARPVFRATPIGIRPMSPAPPKFA